MGLGRGAWFMDQPVKKGLDEEVIWVGSFWERMREGRKEREREVFSSGKMSKERERERERESVHVCR